MAATIASASDPDPTSTAGSTSGKSEASGHDFGFWDLGILSSFLLKTWLIWGIWHFKAKLLPEKKRRRGEKLNKR